ncbi:hypothetical protein DQ04_00201040 [Trypanosoma grayi]|uniref:hypothetical protein n=1 Tax=Trypanosoma grayi TaxID=71804 RepID=UPI0004F48CC6|nr:hypothetical protein DQ04_00201040 [Trypanosoma grayi]KEG15051.1 hypothetical protein DQ04_00201040 [Trypanosoma grayi]
MCPMGKGRAIIIAAAAVTVSVVPVVAGWLALKSAARKRELHAAVAEMEKAEGNTVHLLSFQRWELAPSVSPPCTKVETFLRLAKIPYEVHVVQDTSVSPTECPSCIVHNGRRIEDFNAIEYLTTEFQVEMDQVLTEEQKAIGTLIKSMLEYESRVAYYLTITGDGAHCVVSHAARVFGLPRVLVMLFVWKLRGKVLRIADLVGLSPSKAQYEAEYLRDFQAIEHIIGDKAFLFGDTPSSLDCGVYAALLPIVMLQEARQVSAPFAYVAQSEVLTGYVQRMSRAAFPERDKLLG